jgi:DNA-binding MarR family transcriptional regulator
MAKIASSRRDSGEPAKPAAAARSAQRGAKPSDLLVSSKVIRLSNILRRSSTLIYRRKFGLSQVEWRIVALVGEHGPVSLNALAEQMALDKGQTSRSVSALVARRLVLREYRRDGRGVGITLSTRGSQIYDDLMASALERNRVLLQGLDETEKVQLFKLLDRLTGIARGILERERRDEKI